MDEAELEQLQELRRRHKRRLQILQQQQAAQGFQTPPATIMEIEDLTAEIKRIDESLSQYNRNTLPRAKASPRPEPSATVRPNRRTRFSSRQFISAILGFATILSCIAALIVVPEVRQALGLDSDNSLGSGQPPSNSAEDTLLQAKPEWEWCTDPLAVLPASLSPDTEPERALKEIVAADKNGAVRAWPTVPLDDLPFGKLLEQSTADPNVAYPRHSSFLYLTIRNQQAVGSWLELTNSIKVSLRSDNAPEHIDVIKIIRGAGGCGGGESRDFPPIQLQRDNVEYAVTRQNTDAPFFTLQPGEGELFLIPFECRDTGIYTPNVEFVYKKPTGGNGIGDVTNIAPVICAKSITVWAVQLPREGESRFITSQQYNWNGSYYQEE